MAKINVQITPRNFELIRDKIGTILTDELSNQTYITDLGIDRVWKERSIPWDLTELPAINVMFDQSTLERSSPIDQARNNRFFVDIVANSNHTGMDEADKLSSIIVQRIAGIVEYILEAPEYLTLDFAPGFIEHTEISDIKTGRIDNQNDSHSSIVCRVTFEVKSVESQADIDGVDLETISSVAEIEESDKGYYWLLEETTSG